MRRDEQKLQDTWDLEKIFSSALEYYAKLDECSHIADEIFSLKGQLSHKDELLKALKLLDKLGIAMEMCANYSYMKVSEDIANQESQKLFSTFRVRASEIEEKVVYFDVEFTSLSDEFTDSICESPQFSDYKVMLTRLKRRKQHILTDEGERIMALFSSSSGIYSQIFDDLTDSDMKFPDVDGKELNASTFSVFLHDKDRETRKKAYFNYYSEFDKNKQHLARIYEGSIRENIFASKVRGYESTLSSRLFEDNVDKSVYTSLIDSAHRGFDLLHKFYALKAKKLGIDNLSHYDVYMPLVQNFEKNITYDEAVEMVIAALAPLGDDYQKILLKGLTSERWVDRYPNENKSSGAYSNGGFVTLPYIMMNYNQKSYRDMFTIAHEGGHSMHSYYSARNNPFSCYSYSIFEAEVASTFNERLLSDYLLKNASSDDERAYLLSSEADDIVATFFRQTMFAEFELKIYEICESSQPITLDVITDVYSVLLRDYFGDGVELFDMSALEALRIPHFYRPFYVYKYATGISAAIMLSQRVLSGGEKERSEYISFLSRGGSLFPVDNLKKAGADLTKSSSFDVVLKRFEKIIDMLE